MTTSISGLIAIIIGAIAAVLIFCIIRMYACIRNNEDHFKKRNKTRTLITLDEFIFTLNQDEDCLLTIINYDKDTILYHGWKSGINYYKSYNTHKNWYIQDFIIVSSGMEICITQNPED